MTSHTSLNTDLFNPASISKETNAFNQKLMDIMSKGPKWYEVGAETYRQMRARGETPLPPAILLPQAQTYHIPSREPNRSIPCRILKPENNNPITGIFMHIHGGGWVLQNETSQDAMLLDIANSTNLLVISVGYRLAPESPFPAGPEDCYDAAEHLIKHSDSEFQAPLSFIGGESAGGHLSMLTALHLLQHKDQTLASFRLKGLLLHFGCYDLTFTPSVFNFRKPQVLVLDLDLMEKYLDAFLPDVTASQRKHPSISPLYADLESLRGKLPAALFTCGTEDPLLDDTVFMSAKWQTAGAETVVRILPGAPHAYIGYPRGTEGSLSEVGLDATAEFVKKFV